MNIHHITRGHWLNKGMDIQVQKIDEDRSAVVAITGVEFLDNGLGGKISKICYAIRFMHQETELHSRPIDTQIIDDALAGGGNVVEASFEWLKQQDGVSSAVHGFTALFESALGYGLEAVAKKGKASRL